MRLIKKTTGLVNNSQFLVSNEWFIFKDKEYICIYNKDNEFIAKIFFEQNLNLNGIQVINKEMLLLDEFNTPSLYKIDPIMEKSCILLDSDEKITPESYPNFDKLIISRKLGFLKYTSGIYYTREKRKCYFNDDFCANFIINDMIFAFSRSSFIILNDEKSGEPQWEFSIKDFPSYINGFGREQEADIKQVIGLYNNLLWIHIGGFHLVGIDIKTGSMQCHIEDMRDLLHLSEEDSRYFDYSPSDKYAIHLDSENGLLKAFAHRYYIEINLNTLTGCVKKDFGKKTGESWRITNSLFYQERPNLLYFSGHYKSDGPNAYGIFDTEKSEIIWSALSNEDTGSFYTPPQANDRLLAVLDDKQNLFVYENV